MGTRNITQVVYQGKTMLSHYCQWDGYFSGAGEGVLEFLKNKFKKETFVANLLKLESITNKSPSVQGYTDEDWDKLYEKHPNLSRDCAGYEALGMIQDGTLELDYLDLKFPYDSLFCEYLYLVDLDNDTLEVYKGLNKTKLDPSERFYSEEPDESYYGVKLHSKYPLNALPDKLVEDEVEDDEEEEECNGECENCDCK